MNLQQCARCKKRPAMVFITRLENGKSINEGLCLVCAKELGIKPITDILHRMGVDDNEMEEMFNSLEAGLPDLVNEEANDGKVPTLNLSELFGGKMNNDKASGSNKKQGKASADAPTKKALSTYCTNLNQKAVEGKDCRRVLHVSDLGSGLHDGSALLFGEFLFHKYS